MVTKISVLDKGSVELIDHMGDDLSIVQAARVSYAGESKGETADKKLLFYLMENHHTTPFEMVEFKFRIKCPLFVARQWMRHRTWSYNEISRRYTDSNIEFYYPKNWRTQATDNKQASTKETAYIDEKDYYGFCVKNCFEMYETLLQNGVCREQARMILPQSMYTEFIAKTDAHNLMHFLQLRMSEHAQYEMRVYAKAIYYNIFRQLLPWTAEAFELYRLK